MGTNERLRDTHSFGKGASSCVRFITPLREELVVCSSLQNELLANTPSINLVLGYEVLEHLANESAAIGEIRRVLKLGGEMILSVPNKAWFSKPTVHDYRFCPGTACLSFRGFRVEFTVGVPEHGSIASGISWNS